MIPRSGQGFIGEKLYEKIATLSDGPCRLMEVCGTHTTAISRFGIRRRLSEQVGLLSGPGCPVCVTPCEQIDQAIAMAREPGVTLATFGDMMRVPGSVSSLELERARGCEVRTVYTPFDALQLALAEPRRIVVLFGIGFETTSPTVAAVLIRAVETKIKNFLVIPVFKLVLPAMSALLADNQSSIDGFICPGHVGTIIGAEPFRHIASEYLVPCVIAGFEALDILTGVYMLLEQLQQKRAEVEVQYRRAVTEEGNPTALAIMERVFRRCDARWRGIGVIPQSGLELADEFAFFDARNRLSVGDCPVRDLPEGCACGDVMRGLLLPRECPLFGAECSPADPVGPCMVSSEGACAAYMRFGG